MIVLFTVHDFFVYHTLRNILIKIYPVVLTITTFAATIVKVKAKKKIVPKGRIFLLYQYK
jgi:hypothetical protein